MFHEKWVKVFNGSDWIFEDLCGVAVTAESELEKYAGWWFWIFLQSSLSLKIRSAYSLCPAVSS